jgi:TolB-like protein/AraC-like DNA-binding protein
MSEHLSMNEALISKLTDIVLSNLRDESFSVEKLAKEAGMSRFTLNRKIRSISQQDISQFIRSVRLHEAMKLLQNNEATIAEIAYAVGFGSPAYFTKCFHEYYGYPPGKVKEQLVDPQPELISGKLHVKPVKAKFNWKQVVLVSSGIAATVIVFLLIINAFENKPASPAAAFVSGSRKSIAVLPVRNLSDNLSDQYVYEGFMEEIYSNLTKMHELNVISRSSVEQYQGTNMTIPQICKELGVDYIVEGSGQKNGNTFLFRVHLIDASSGINIWSDHFSQRKKSTGKLFREQSRMTKNIAAEMQTEISREEEMLIEKVPTASIETYNLYLEGNKCQKEYEQTRDLALYVKAVNLYNAALAFDPSFARGYISLARGYISRYKWEEYFDQNYLDSAEILIDKALSYDKFFDEAYFLKGEIKRLNGESEAALTYFDKTLNINPNHVDAIATKWYILTWVLDDYVAGLENCQRALNLIRGLGLTTMYRTTARTYLDAGFPEIAKEYYKKAFLIDGNKASYLGNISWVEWCKGNFDDALKIRYQRQQIDSMAISLAYYCVFKDRREEAYAQARKGIENNRKVNVLLLQGSHRVGFTLWQVGKKDEAESYFRQQIKNGEESIKLGRDIEQRRAAHYDLAGTYAFLGDKEKAYVYLDEFSKKHAFPLWWITMIKNDLLFESIRNEERFQKIVQKMESKYIAEHNRVMKWIADQNQPVQ